MSAMWRFCLALLLVLVTWDAAYESGWPLALSVATIIAIALAIASD